LGYDIMGFNGMGLGKPQGEIFTGNPWVFLPSNMGVSFPVNLCSLKSNVSWTDLPMDPFFCQGVAEDLPYIMALVSRKATVS
jgi:hypothetical protein